jgi:hypothetical protein
MGKGGGRGPSQVQRIEPPEFQQPFLQRGFEAALQNFNTPRQFFPGATYVPFSQQTEQALGLQQQRALEGSPLVGAAQQRAQNILEGQAGGNVDPQQFRVDISPANIRGLAGQENIPTLQGAQSSFLGQLTGLPEATQTALTQTAQGQNLTNNPFLDETFNRAQRNVTETFNREVLPALSAQFSLAGRTGSGAQADVQSRAAGQVSDTLGDLANQIYGGNFQRERDRQLAAAGQLGSLSQAQQGLGLQAAGQGANLFNQALGRDIQRRGLESQNILGARGQDLQAQIASQRNELQASLANQQNQLAQQQQAFGATLPLARDDFFNIGQLGNVGAQVEGLGQRALDDQIRRFNFGQTERDDALQRYLSAITGNFGSTSTQQTNPGSGARFSSALGGAATGFGIGGPIGGLIGGLGGLFF